MPADRQVVQRSDGSWLIDGKLQIDDLKEVLKVPALPEEQSGRYQTLGGLVMLQVGRVPVTGDSFDAIGYRFEVVDMDGKRVDRVWVSRIPEEPPTSNEA
jgi:putative hemolysin